MSMLQCNCTSRCTVFSIIASLIAGIIAAFLQITGTIAVPTTFLTAAIAAAVAYLGLLLLTTALDRRTEISPCKCDTIRTLLAGILGTIVFAVILLTVDVAAVSVIGAILVGLLTFFVVLTLTATACLIRCLSGCEI